MYQCARFLFHSVWTSLGAVLAFAAVVTAGAFATGVPDGAQNLFTTYFAGLPLTSLLILFILAFNLCTANLNLALSLGARRRDYFIALQGALLAYTGACWLLQIAVSLIPTAFAWANPQRWTILTALRGPHLWSYPPAVPGGAGPGLRLRDALRPLPGPGRDHPHRLHLPGHLRDRLFVHHLGHLGGGQPGRPAHAPHRRGGGGRGGQRGFYVARHLALHGEMR